MLAVAQILAVAVSLQSPAASACPIIENLTILPFESGSAELSAGGRAHIDGWLGSYRYPPAHIELLGNTDRVGSRRANLRLSIRRASAIRDYLISRGYPAERITVRGAGEASVLVETPDRTAEAQNRIVWMTTGPDPREPRC